MKNCEELKFKITPRLEKLAARSRKLAIEGKRNLYTADSTQLVYHWTDKCNAIAPQSGDYGFKRSDVISLGDHGCRIDLGIDFPGIKSIPSKTKGYIASAENWALDYAYLLDNSPAEIFENEMITGEFHWEMNEIRKYSFSEKVHELGRLAREAGAGGTSHGHTCPDLSIGLKQGWGGILERINRNLARYERLGNVERAVWLRGARYVCEAIIRYIAKYSEKARQLAAAEKDILQKERYNRIADTCLNIAGNAPLTFHEAVQWIHFAVLTDRMVGHGNGYGRLDLYLAEFYDNDIKEGRLTRGEAREYLAEMFLKLRGQFFCLGGRDSRGNDAVNEVSWLVIEAYDMIDDYNNLGVMWHPEINRKFYLYVCDVLARHGAGIPALINYEIMKDSELRSGVAEEDACNVAYSGCQWYCIPGKEYCDQDVNAIVLTDPMWRAIDKSIIEVHDSFEKLYTCFIEEFRKTCIALRNFKDAQYDELPQVWPEIVTSLNCHGPIERGLDITAPRGVDYQYTSTNILGIPNVADSLFAIKSLIFDKQSYTLEDVRSATRSNWKDNEIMRLDFLAQHKYGNDLDDVDALYVRITESIAEVMDNIRNNRGQPYRASLFQFQGHTVAEMLGATPDGRLAAEPMAHGCNPTAGRNTEGLLATANSLVKTDYVKFLGGSLQIEMQPCFFDGMEDAAKYIKDFSEAFFLSGGIQINLNILNLEELKNAIEHPEKPEYQNIIIKVTGYTSRFIKLDKAFQKEFVGRNNYDR